ncbi:hypothetical protein Nepgr_014678 [Nepenthes gracilis]|uniref:Uncharacterized protein n=1 Tax=Nepenthes gracilis TaxID=150966 RepID=A0AAD3XPQ2_NEPGR|nr:hypothetical protein Nepgr_014678 [Nepenthes gracilis]
MVASAGQSDHLQGHLINHSNKVEIASNQQLSNLTVSISTNLRSSNLQASAGTNAATRSSREYTSSSAEYKAKTYIPMSLQPQAQLRQQSDTRHQKTHNKFPFQSQELARQGRATSAARTSQPNCLPGSRATQIQQQPFTRTCIAERASEEPHTQNSASRSIRTIIAESKTAKGLTLNAEAHTSAAVLPGLVLAGLFGHYIDPVAGLICRVCLQLMVLLMWLLGLFCPYIGSVLSLVHGWGMQCGRMSAGCCLMVFVVFVAHSLGPSSNGPFILGVVLSSPEPSEQWRELGVFETSCDWFLNLIWKELGLCSVLLVWMDRGFTRFNLRDRVVWLFSLCCPVLLYRSFFGRGFIGWMLEMMVVLNLCWIKTCIIALISLSGGCD